MKMTSTIFMIFIAYSSAIFAETMDLSIGNPRVESGVFKFDGIVCNFEHCNLEFACNLYFVILFFAIFWQISKVNN